MLRFLATLALALVASSCVLVPAGEIPRLDRAELAASPKLPAITYSLAGGAPGASSQEWLEPELETLFASVFTQARRGSAQELPHVTLRFPKLELEPRIGMYSGILTVITLGIVPFFAPGGFTLEARVEREGQPARDYAYARPLWDWGWVFFLPFSGTDWGERHSLARVRAELHEQLLLEFLRDLRRDTPASR